MPEAVLEGSDTKLDIEWRELHSNLTVLPTDAHFKVVLVSWLPARLRAIAAISGLNLSHHILGKLEMVENLVTREVNPMFSLYSNGEAEAEAIRCLVIIPHSQPTLLEAELLNRKGEEVKPRRVLGRSGLSSDMALSSSTCAAELIKTILGFTDNERLAVLEEVVALVRA